MRARLLLAVCSLPLVACGGGGSATSGGPSGGPTATATATAGGTSGVDSPTSTERADLLSRLAAVDARLTKNPDQAVRRAVNLCKALQKAGDRTPATGKVAEEIYQGVAVRDLTPAQGVAIVAAVSAAFCD